MLAIDPSAQGAFDDIRTAVHDLCARFPGEYWRDLDRERAYPLGFVDALTQAVSLPKTSSANQSGLYPIQIPCSLSEIPCSVE
jgi:hypothetical protein